MFYSTIATLFSFALASNAVSVPQNKTTNAVSANPKAQDWNNLMLNIKVTNQLSNKKDLILTVEYDHGNTFNYEWANLPPVQQAIKYTPEAQSTDFFYNIIDCPNQGGCSSILKFIFTSDPATKNLCTVSYSIATPANSLATQNAWTMQFGASEARKVL
eukprot:Pgem_evm1s543